MFLYELIPAWAPELAASTKDLRSELLADILAGTLGKAGHLINGEQSGLRLTSLVGPAKSVTGRDLQKFMDDNVELPTGMSWSQWLPELSQGQLLDLVSEHRGARANELFIYRRLEVTKDATLDFASRHELPAPSWWPTQETKTPPGKRQCSSENYAQRWKSYQEKGSWPSGDEDELWAKSENYSTGSVRQRRKEYMEALPRRIRDYIKKGGARRVLPKC